MPDQWIWVSRWEHFQHYPFEPGKTPHWIKQYPGQLDDDRYTNLSPRARSLLHDLRMAFARTRGQLSDNTRTLARRLSAQVRRDDLFLLEEAGFIEILSRQTLEQRLEELYASRARPRARENKRENHPSKGGGSPHRSKETEDATPTPTNGAASLTNDNLSALQAFVQRDWDQYPDLNVLLDELTDRGANRNWAIAYLKAERDRRATHLRLVQEGETS